MDDQNYNEPPLLIDLPTCVVDYSPDNSASSNGAVEIIRPERFDYGQYDASVATEIRNVADRIRSRGSEQNAAIADIGAALRGVKEKVGHGNWGAWLSAEFDMSVSTADRYMAVAARFGAKFVTLTNLQPTTQYLLAAKATPTNIADQIVAELEAGQNLSNEAIRNRIAVAKKAAKRAAREAELTPKQPEKRAHVEAAAERDEGRWEREQAGREEKAKAAAAILISRLGDQLAAVVELFDGADMLRVRSELREAHCRLAEKEATEIPASMPPVRPIPVRQQRKWS